MHRDMSGRQTVAVGPHQLAGILRRPAHPRGLVVFAHGAGSSHLSVRNASVAGTLNARGMATLLFDLLTPGEARDRDNLFEIPLLARRVEEAIGWVRAWPEFACLPVGLFGASTGAAAARIWRAAPWAGFARRS